MRVLLGAFQAKPGAALARSQGWLPWQGRGWFPALCLGRHPGVRELPIKHLQVAVVVFRLSRPELSRADARDNSFLGALV